MLPKTLEILLFLLSSGQIKGVESSQSIKLELAYQPENYHTIPQQRAIRQINFNSTHQEVDGQDYLRQTLQNINTQSKYLNPSDFAKGRYYMERKEYDWRRPEIRGTGVPLGDEHFEGDYLFFDRSTVEAVKTPSLSLVSASTYKKDRWPDAVVPYIIKDDFPAELRAAIGAAMESIQNVSCIRFVPYDLVKDKKKFKVLPLVIKKHKKNRCAGSVGLNGTRPNELGFCHEQCRNDRDGFIDVIWNNIDKRRYSNFLTYNFPFKSYTPYDHESIMHYYDWAFSIDTKHLKSMKSRKKKHPMLGNELLSKFDVIKLNRHYHCGETSNKCKDKMSATQCNKYGMGIMRRNDNGDVDRSKCMDSEWALRECPFTCGQCYKFLPHVGSTIRVKRSIGPLNKREACIDNSNDILPEHCVVWARKGLCYKPNHVTFMRENCAKSCAVHC